MGDDSGVLNADWLTLFQQLLPEEFIAAARHRARIRENNRVYTSAVVIWLMVWQRLQSRGTLEIAVLELLRNPPASLWSQPCKRLTQAAEVGGAALSSHTGAYNQARKALSLPVVEQCCDRVFEKLMAAEMPVPGVRRAAFFLDGTTVRLCHTEELVRSYPPSSNQHGPSHWPLIRMLVAHDLYRGLAMRPEWGPMNGNQAVSEQSLLDQSIHRLPSGAVVTGDANFGVFSVAYATDQQDRPALLRLTAVRAQSLLGGALRDGIDQRVVWKPSRYDRQSHPQLPVDASVTGRVIVRQVQPSNGAEAFLLALFTTLPDPVEETVTLYGHRWNIEVDLRTLKGTLRMEELTCTTSAMVAKEIDLALLSYNLVRSVQYLTARKAGLEPRAFSFTKVRNVLNAFLPKIAAARDEQQAQKFCQDLLYYLGQTKLPRRKRSSYPRAVWPKPKTYPARH